MPVADVHPPVSEIEEPLNFEIFLAKLHLCLENEKLYMNSKQKRTEPREQSVIPLLVFFK